ncbi:unnamed protein product, partial [Mesorhabditis spiculigera]
MRVLLALLLPVLGLAQQCTIGQGSNGTCANHIAVIIDSSSYLGTSDRADQLAQFINTYLSQYDLTAGQTLITMGFYGMGDPSVSWSPIFLFFGQSDISMICNDWQTLFAAEQSNNMGMCTIATALASLYNTTRDEDWNYDQIVWLTASNDTTDIQTASAMLPAFPNTNFTVVSIGGGDFSSWTGARVLCQNLPFPMGFESKIAAQACRSASGNNQCNHAGTTAMPTTPRPTGTAPTPTSQCPCDITKSWNDVMVVYDGSNVLTDVKFQTMVVLLQSIISRLPISQAIGQNSRVGVISYAKNVRLIANLTKYNSPVDAIMDDWTRDNVEQTNIKAAIDLARDTFNNPKQHRQNARKVIILAASTYREGTDMPLSSASTFKDNGGVIIVIGYGDLKGEASQVLRQIASTGYFIDATSKQPDFNQMNSLFCKANCFCPTPYSPVSSAATGEPTEGCQYVSKIRKLKLDPITKVFIRFNGNVFLDRRR